MKGELGSGPLRHLVLCKTSLGIPVLRTRYYKEQDNPLTGKSVSCFKVLIAEEHQF